ncbi:predicted protein [Sclerotinia sclerotiorum 1980 UF-70]|uniref:Uncharacterized protein n=2 Tax=Sclerotinia sclerotiorum (strain ATCC 18683 / 1980 / Ss-1) TaxID=665079 RepID=A7ELQ4_SCLS1|nr:predicted protein [Sclerotinia sclerotiorum 1980 UF-70]APA09597.1 hypothetical protein sscle_05g043670 [Sclerotinia sclerotiorum 1980 UF-70]EDO03770.1 predicted protein [Sclerotinia sclerotiorum 1980 UF-70]
MSYVGPRGVWVLFACSCEGGGDLIQVGEGEYVEIVVKQQSRICTHCNQNEANGTYTSIKRAFNKEAEMITKAYFEAFDNLGRWGLRPKGEGHEDIRISGRVCWIRRLQEGLTDAERNQPGFVKLGSNQTVPRPEFRFGGQAPAFLPRIGTSKRRHEYLSNIRNAQTKIYYKAAKAQADLEAKGFMALGEFIKVTEKKKEKRIKSDDYIEMVPNWDFLKVTDRPVVDLVNIVWEWKGGNFVQVEGMGVRVPSVIVMG